MSFWERIKQILDALAYFGGLFTAISIITVISFFFIGCLADKYWNDEEFDEHIG